MQLYADELGVLHAPLGSICRTYLIQDYEPGFYEWSEAYALASASYGRDYLPIHNSSLLADYFAIHTDGPVVPDLVCATGRSEALRTAPATRSLSSRVGWRKELTVSDNLISCDPSEDGVCEALREAWARVSDIDRRFAGCEVDLGALGAPLDQVAANLLPRPSGDPVLKVPANRGKQGRL